MNSTSDMDTRSHSVDRSPITASTERAHGGQGQHMPGPGRQYVTYARENDLTVYIDRDEFRFVREFAYDAMKRERDEAVSTLRALNEETVLAGCPGGDRTVTLANVRALRAQRDELAAALHQIINQRHDATVTLAARADEMVRLARAAIAKLGGAK